MNRCCLFGGLVLATAFAAAADVASSGVVFTGGVVTDRGLSLVGVRVDLEAVSSAYSEAHGRWVGEAAPPLATALTDEEGRFRVSAPVAGSFEVIVRHAGRIAMQYGPFLAAQARELPALEMTAAADAVLRVVDSQGRPVAGATVAVSRPAANEATGASWRPAPREARTDDAGIAVVSLIAGEPPVVDVQDPGVAASWRIAAVNGVVRLPAQPHIETTLAVGHDGGELVEGVLVLVGGHGWPVGKTDLMGRLSLSLPMTSPMRAELLARDGTRRTVQLVAARGRPLVLPPPQSSVAAVGKILDAATGAGLPGALIAPSTDLGAVTVAGDQGLYALPIVVGRGTTLEVHAPEYLPRRVTVSASEMTAGRLPAVGLERAARVEGRVLGSRNEPLAGALVETVHASRLASRPLSPSETPIHRTVSGPDGTFSATGLRPLSHYEIRARKSGYFPDMAPVSTSSARAAGPKVELRLQPGRAVDGRVSDEEGRPLEGARIELRPARREDRAPPKSRTEASLADDDPASARSDAAGHFRVPQCPAAEFDLEVRLPGYAPVRRAGFKAGRGTGSLDVGTLVLRRGTVLAGRVVDDRGQPLVQAEVFLFERLPAERSLPFEVRKLDADATSGLDGSFRIDDLPAGLPVHLAVVAEDHVPATVRGVRPPTEEPVLVRLDRGLQVVGRVVDGREQPVPGTRISIGSERIVEGDPYGRPLGATAFHETVADGQGRFVLTAVRPGRLVLSASAEGFVPLEEMEVERHVGEPPRPVVVRLRTGAVVEGRIVTTDGEPVADARIVVGSGTVSSDAEGRYRLSGVPEGEQQLEVRHADFRRFTETVRVEPGDNRFDIELPAGVPVEGWVAGSNGEPAAGAEVLLREEGTRDRHGYRTRTEENGRFRFDPVATGVYRLEASAPGGAIGGLAEAVVVEEPVGGLEVILQSGAAISGRVLGLSQDELAAVGLEARDGDGRVRSARVDATGAYRFEAMAPGVWLLRATVWQGQREARARVPVSVQDEEIHRDLEFGRGFTVAGRVLFDDEPLGNATLSVRGQRFAVERTVVTSFEGLFQIENLEPDQYWLGISRPDLLVAHNQWLEVTADRDVVIRLSAATVSGVVKNADQGEPIAGAWLRLSPTDGPEFVILDSSQGDGSFHLLRVPPGGYRIAASADGYVGAELEVVVEAGRALQGLELLLQPTAGGFLQVAQADGAVPQLVHLLVLDAAGVAVVAETRAPGADGQVQLATLPPGSWQLLVSAPQAAMVAQPITVPGPAAVVTLPSAGSLDLRVPPLAATDLLAGVSVLGLDQQPLWVLGPGGAVQSRWPMVGGQARIENVPQGPWIVQVEAIDGRTWTSVVTAPGAGVLDVVLP